ncbi:DUF1456 family protein [Chitinimonas koreensis]|uniref:DUF1456 family protein n=1 Tax=Chitinimonas koreensis TaxID=356302 RepID=UPI00041BCB62|nr:DUF1456 family protein [Chitinimonas koreensis]QNM95396.1 DUF1456 family protein [Chitinimonas koreensis]
MINNDVLRSVRYMLDISDARIGDIIRLAGYEASKADIVAFLKRDDEEGYRDCSDEVLAHFLDGLIFHRRGRDDSRPRLPVELPVYNNTVLKKLRVAFELKEEDILEIMSQAGFEVSKPELSAFFRKPDHKNYRRCGDQFLRNFLKGLTLRMRPSTR